MTRSAVAMMLATWAVIFYFTGKFFWMVLRTPPRDDDVSDEPR